MSWKATRHLFNDAQGHARPKLPDELTQLSRSGQDADKTLLENAMEDLLILRKISVDAANERTIHNLEQVDLWVEADQHLSCLFSYPSAAELRTNEIFLGFSEFHF